MDRWKNRVALVTGASSGIGAAICRDLVKNGMVVLGCARRVDRIQALSDQLKGESGVLHPYKCDMTKEDQILAMFEHIKKQFGRLDVCVNNAARVGKVADESLLEGKTDEWRELLDLNVLGYAIVAREAIKIMRENNVVDGHVFFIGGVAGRMVAGLIPSLHFYCCTKFAELALAEGFRDELIRLKSRIKITVINPGIVQTEILDQCIPKEFLSPEFNMYPPLQDSDVSLAIIQCLSHSANSSIDEINIRSTEENLKC